jgi:flagellum-specific peptidoglycan hydrolase FlgJ
MPGGAPPAAGGSGAAGGAAGGAAQAPTGKAPPGGKFTSPEEFVNTMMPWAEYASKALGGTPALGILGQWAGESGQGKSLPAGFNYAGIKAGTKYKKGDFVLTEEKYTAKQLEHAQKSGESLAGIVGQNDKIKKKGREVTIDEWFGKGSWQKAKDEGKQWVQVKSYFAEFSDLKDFTDSYVGFLKGARYKDAIAAQTPEDFGYKVAAAGYATASPDKYAQKVGSFAKSFQGTTGKAADGAMYAAAGGVASGPQSGYPATLHGTEAIVPLDGQSYQSKQAVTAVSKAVSGDQLSQQSADNSMASTGPSVVPVPVPGGGGGGDKQAAPPQKSDNSVKADVRFADDTFNRAISKDFAHPTAFTSVGFA